MAMGSNPTCHMDACWPKAKMAGKKKHKLRKQLIQKADPGEEGCSSDENAQFDFSKKTCSHLVKSVNFNEVRKVLRDDVDFKICRLCPVVETELENHLDKGEVALWMCLQCGNIGCGRYSDRQHAIAHYKTPRSDSHALCINLSSWSVWCYDCDDDVLLDSNKKLLDCVEFLKKNIKCSSASKAITSPIVNQQLPVHVLVDTSTSNTVVDEPIKAATATSKENSQKLAKSGDVLDSLPKVKGLTNLGNTCFFNAVMQSLSQTHLLTQLLDLQCIKNAVVIAENNESEATETKLEPLSITINEGGPLNQSLASFLKEMNSMGRTSRTVNPGHLFGQVCKKAPQFRGMMQQDSHELLRHLLDGLKSEEAKRYQAGILKVFNLSEKVIPKQVDDATRSKIKAYGKLIQPTLVDQIFSGQLISTVLCEECKMSSQVFEPFLDLSLPVMEEKPIRPSAVKKIPLDNEENVGCFGKTAEKPSKYQEKKAKKQAKRDAKVQRNKAKQQRRRTISLTGATADDPLVTAELPVMDGEAKVAMETDADSTKNSVETKDTSGDLSDADVEDNAETESICSVNTNAPAMVSGKHLADDDDCRPGVLDYKKELEDALPFREFGPEHVVEELCLNVKGLQLRQDSLPNANGLVASDGKTLLAVKDWKVCNGDLVDNDHTADTRNGVEDVIWGSSEEENGKSGTTKLTGQSSKLKNEWVLKSSTTLSPRYKAASRECSVLSCLNQFTAHELLTDNNKFGCENCMKMRDEERAEKSSSPSAEPKKKTTIYTNASKQLLVFSPPAILTLHLKRFQQVGFSLRKVNRHVDFPLTLDLAPYCSLVCLGFPTVKKGQRQVLYSLYAVVEHSGRLTGGHYTAYVKVRPQNAESKRFLNERPTGDCNVGRLMDQVHSKLPDDNVDVVTNEAADAVGRWYHVSDGHVSESSEASVLKCQAYLLFYERIV